MSFIDRLFRFGGLATITMSDGTVTPSDDDVIKAKFLKLVGTLTANANLVLPLLPGADWIVWNATTGGFSVLVKGASGASVTMENGRVAGVGTDGVDFKGVSMESGAPTGPAGGDLAGTYPDPDVAQLTGTGGFVTVVNPLRSNPGAGILRLVADADGDEVQIYSNTKKLVACQNDLLTLFVPDGAGFPLSINPQIEIYNGPAVVKLNCGIQLVGGVPSTTGSLRGATNTTLLAARNAANTADIPVVRSDAADGTIIGGTNGGAVHIANNAGTIAGFDEAGATYLRDPNTGTFPFLYDVAVSTVVDHTTDVQLTIGGVAVVAAQAAKVAFYAGAPAAQPTITGALSTVADAPAKAVLTSIIAALTAVNLVIDGTT